MNRFLAILFCVLVSWGAHGETHELVFRNLNMSQGISDNYVRSILRDKFGMMWFVTLNGLNRFDGYRFKKYDVGHDPYWNDALYHVWEDADSNIWVTGASYVYAYHRASDCIDTRVQGVLAAYGMPGKGAGGDAPAPEGLFVDEDRNLWCLYGSTLFCYDFVRRRLAKVRMEPGLKLHYLACRGGKARLLCSDSGGRGGVWSVDLRRGEMSRVVPTGHGVGEESRLYVDSRGRFWHYNLHEEGLFLLDESGLEWRDAAANSLLCGKMITAMMDDCDGNLWIGTDNDGIFFMDAQTLRVEDVRCRQGTSFSLTDNHVASFYMDDEFSTVWVGMSKQGVAFCNMKQPAISFVRMQGMEDVSCIAEDRDDRLWFGFDSQGIGCFDGTVMRHIKASPDGISSNQVVCSFIDSEGRHWWGSYNGGLYWMEEMKVHRVDDQRLHYVVAMAEDGNGNLWLATGDEGLFCMNSDGRVNSYTMGNSLLSTNSLTDLAMADGHMLYVGTSNGLYRLDTQNHRFAQLSREHINTLLVDGHRQLWIGMRDGLGVMDVNAASHDIEVLRVSDGLAHNYVHGLAEDHFGNVWVSTMDGVTMVSTSEHPSGSGVKGTHRCTSYYEYDGLGNIVFNRHAIACMANGDILVGGIGALVRIVPDGNVRSAAMRHPVRFTGLTVGGRRIEVGQPTDDGRVLLPCNILQVDHLELKYSDTNIGIEVSSMNYLDLPHQHYVYRMDNQKEWSRMENNTVVLHRLAPGRYLLHVKVEEVDSSYQNPVATLSVVVSPPFWMSAAAFVLYAVLAVLAIVLIVMYLHRRNKRKLLQQRRELKAQQREEMQEAKMRFFTNISHDLRTPLSLIITPVERLLKGTLAAPVRHQLELVQRNARLLMDDITQLLDFRKLDESLDLPQLTVGSLTAFVEESCRQFMEGVLPGDVTLSLRQDEDALLVKMDQVKMRRILFNLVSNAIKYNRRGGAVTVETRREEAMAVLAVADTGTGVKDKTRIFERFYQEPHSGDVPYTGSGIGLYMVKQYVSMLGGTIEANDNQPEGTVFEVRLPLTQLQPSAGESGDALPERKACEPDADVHVANSSTILIVEDNADFRSFLHGCLADHYTVVEATNGREALEVLQGRDVHLIVSDVMMPVMDGMELCRAVKTDVELSHIPFIMLTAKAADEHQAVGLREGADDYIVKPFNLEVLLLRIDRLLAWAKGARERFRKMDVKPSEITVSNVDERLIARAIELVEANMDNEAYSVEQLCDDMGMSRSSVYKKLMAITGLSPIHFIRTLRVKRGRQMLEQGGEAVSQVAWQVGLSPKQFARYFKDEYGISPSQLKR